LVPRTALIERLNNGIRRKLTLISAPAGFGKTTILKILEDLEKANLFIVPLDSKRNWYRYHHLFADLLRQRLKQKDQDMVNRMHIKASEWLYANDFMEEAIDYALVTGDSHRAVQLIEGFIDTKWHGGQQVMLFKWLDQLPDEIKLNKPDLGICHARFLFESGRQKSAEKRINQIERTYVSGPESRQNRVGEKRSSEDAEPVFLKGRIAALRAYMASRTGDIHHIPKYAKEARACLPDDDFAWHTIVALSYGIASHVAGDSAAALRAHTEAEATARESGNVYFYLMAKIRRIMEMKNTGQLPDAIEICRELLAEVRERYSSFEVALGHVYGVRGELLYELNDLREALSCTEKSIQLIEKGHDIGVLGYRYCCLVRILCSKGDFAAARKICRTANRLVLDPGVPPWVMSQIRAAKGNLCLKEGKLNALGNRIEEWGLKPDDGNIMTRESEYMLLSRFLITQCRLTHALSLLSRLIDQQKKGGRVISQIEALLIQAAVFSKQHKMVESTDAIRKALSLAEPGGYVRLFVDEAKNINQLLEKCLDMGDNIPKAFVKKLLTARKLSRAIENDRSPVEPLSDRELEVLRFVIISSRQTTMPGWWRIRMKPKKPKTRGSYSMARKASFFTTLSEDIVGQCTRKSKKCPPCLTGLQQLCQC
jgi:LuxR family maltose regulon positive regulatory protein